MPIESSSDLALSFSEIINLYYSSSTDLLEQPLENSDDISLMEAALYKMDSKKQVMQ